MRFILIVLGVILTVHALALFGLLGYGLATGRFDAEKRAQYVATWNGEKLVPPPPEVQEVEEEQPREASGKIAETQIEKELLTREMQMQMQLLRDMQFTVQAAQTQLNSQREEFLASRDAFEEAVAERQEQAKDEGFRKALERYAQMKSRAVKDDFMQMEDEEMLRYIAAMDVDTAKKVLEQFKTDQEQAKRLRVMQMLEEYYQLKLDDQSQEEQSADTLARAN